MTRYDIRNDPKFKSRVAKIEGNQFAKILKVPLRVNVNDHDVFVACIGINDSYMVVYPILEASKGGFEGFEVEWTKNDQFKRPTNLHETISTAVLNWMMLHANEASFVKKKHGDVKIVELAIETCSKIVSQETMEKAGPKFARCFVQGTLREDIINPYHR